MVLPNGVTLRDFYSPRETRESILTRVRDGFLKRFPIENERVRIELANADYDPRKSKISLEDYEKALLTGGRLSVPLRGNVRLLDKVTGQLLEEKEVTLANVPYLTDDGTFVMGGSHYVTNNQSRLKPGIYARRKDNGELESHINTKSGTGPQMRLFMEPDTGIYRIQADKANIKLYPILRELGVPDEKLQAAWGPEILKANQDAWDKQAFGKFYTRLLKGRARPEATPEEQKAEIAKELERSQLDAEVNTRTLGKPHANLSLDAIIDASNKLLKINRNEDQEDDRDHPANRTFHSVDDFLTDRVLQDAGKLGRTLLWKAGYDRSLRQLRPGYFTPQLEGLIVGNQLSQPVPGINPVEIFDQQKRVIQLGEGGISSMESIPMSSRNVHPGQLGLIDPIRSSESKAIGVDQRFAIAARRGSDNHVYFPLRNRKTGEVEYLNPVQLHGKVVAFPQASSFEKYKTPLPMPLAGPMASTLPPQPQVKTAADLLFLPKTAAKPVEKTPPLSQPLAAPAPTRPVPGMRNGKLAFVNPNEADYEMVSPSHMFTDTSHAVPLSSGMKGARLFISSKYFTQALPLQAPESPLVDTLDEDTGHSFSRTLGNRLGVKTADVDGTVAAINKRYIDIKDTAGKMHRHELKHFFPHNRKTFTTDMPMVQAGMQIVKGAPIARNNFTDQEGRLSLGKNLRVAFMPAPNGASFEDSIVLSESAAKKLTSSHLYGFDVEHKHGVDSNKQKFVSLFPNKYTNQQLAKLDANGMVKPGVHIEPGDPVFLSFAPRTLSSKDQALGNLHKVLRNSYQDLSQTWEKPTAGVVAQAIQHRGGLRANIATSMPLQEGDKISARQGAKGVVGKIIPDDKMVRNAAGEAVDVIINPAALIGRVNPSMVFEALLGKIAHATGKKYRLPAFSQDSIRDFVAHELQANNLSDTEELEDPNTGRKVGGVLTGRQYFMKLEHTSESKQSGRGQGGADLNDQPTKGGDEGAKRLGGLQALALLSHGATEVLRDAKLYRGSSNTEMWRRLKLGHSLPAPKTPFIYDKFLNSLRGAGINVQQQGDKLNLLAMTDRDVDKMATHEVMNSETVDPRTAEPVKGGLMDFALHGGPEGKGWSYIKLDDPLPSPVMEEPVRRLLGLTEAQMREIIAGKTTFQGRRGPGALHEALKGLRLDEMEAHAKEMIRGGRKTKRDEAVRQLNFITGLKKAGIEPHEMMVTKVPVIPPTYRPITKMGNMLLTSDANYLYKDLMTARDAHRANKADLPDEEIGDERLAVYDALKAIQGLGDPINAETANKGVKGFIRTVAGVGGPKTGLFMSKVIGHPVNNVGRGVIVPDSDLNMDQVGVPEKMAWRMFGELTMREMVREGMSAVDAAKHIEKTSDFGKRYLLRAMDKYNVMLSRDPALHRFSIMGSQAVLVPGNNIRLSPLVVKPFGADFDGDQMNLHVPLSDEAQKEVREKMFPSKNLFGLKKLEVHYTPSQEFILGLYNAVRPKKGVPPMVFRSRQEAADAYKKGLIAIDQPIQIAA